MDEGEKAEGDPDAGICAEARAVLLNTLLKMTGEAALRIIHRQNLAMADEWEGVVVLRPGSAEDLPQRQYRETARLVAAELARRAAAG